MTLLTAEQVAERFGVTPRAVRFWIEHGDLEAQRFGRAWAIDEAALETFERPQVGRPPPERGTQKRR